MPRYYTIKTQVGFHLVVNITDYTVVTGQISFIQLLVVCVAFNAIQISEISRTQLQSSAKALNITLKIEWDPPLTVHYT